MLAHGQIWTHTAPLWEGACSRWQWRSQHIDWLALRHRGEPPSLPATASVRDIAHAGFGAFIHHQLEHIRPCVMPHHVVVIPRAHQVVGIDLRRHQPRFAHQRPGQDVAHGADNHAAACDQRAVRRPVGNLHAKGVEVWCAPTVDEREMWQVSMRHVAHEGRCFVVSACQVQASPEALGVEVANWPVDRPLIAGGSVIVGPMGDILAGPLVGEAGLLTAQIDTDQLVRARYDYDVVGHYARPDIFELVVDERAKPGVRYITD